MMANTDPITRTYTSQAAKEHRHPTCFRTQPIAMKPNSNSLRNPLSIAKAYTQFFFKKSVIATFHLNQRYHKCHECFLLDKYKVTVPSQNQEFSKLEPKYRL